MKRTSHKRKEQISIPETFAAFAVIAIFFIVFVALAIGNDNQQVFEEPSEENSMEMSEEISKEPSEESSEESSKESSEESSKESSEESSKESSEEPSEESSEESSKESSEEQSEEPSMESSEEPSVESSEEPSMESSEEPSVETSKEIYEEIMQEFPQHDFAYALYDIQSGQMVTEYNTSKMFRTGCTIKPAVLLYLLSERNITDNWENKKIQILKQDDDNEGVSPLRNDITKYHTRNWGDYISVKYLVYVTLVYSDNIGYQMLCREYFPQKDFSDFNRYMREIGSNIKLGEDEIVGTVYTAATVEDQLAVWKAINSYLTSSKPGAKNFKKHLTNKEGYKFAEKVLYTTTASMAGWVNGSTTFNECYIIEGKYIAVILTATGKKTPPNQDIDTRPLKKIAVKLHGEWEAYNS